MILSGIFGPPPLLREKDEGTAGGPSLLPRMFNAHISYSSFEISTQHHTVQYLRLLFATG